MSRADVRREIADRATRKWGKYDPLCEDEYILALLDALDKAEAALGRIHDEHAYVIEHALQDDGHPVGTKEVREALAAIRALDEVK